VSASVYAGNLPSSASEEQLCQLSETVSEAASVSKVEAESPDRFRGLGGSELAVLAELELGVGGARLAPMETPVERPVWVNGTLPGIMAGKRPAPWPTRSN